MSRMCVVVISLIVLCCVHIIGSMENMKNEKADFAFPDDLDTTKIREQNYMHYHFHHDPDFHHHHHHHHHHHPDLHYHGGEDEEEMPEGSQTRNLGGNESLQIPLEFIKIMNEYNEHNVTDLLLDFKDEDEDSTSKLQSRFGDSGEGIEKHAAVKPSTAKGAKCMPELQTVKIASSDDPSIMFIPQCTRIERCGGCCKHNLLACLPEEKETVSFKVFKTQYTGEKKLKFLGNELIMVEKHNKCKCDCRVRPEDCTKFQEYRESECQCVCRNTDEKKKCHKYNETKLWNPDLCTCECRSSLQCSTGSYYDQNECKCLPVQVKRRFATYQRRSLQLDPLPVVPLDEEY